MNEKNRLVVANVDWAESLPEWLLRAGAPSGDPADVDPEIVERLRALGYIQ